MGWRSGYRALLMAGVDLAVNDLRTGTNAVKIITPCYPSSQRGHASTTGRIETVGHCIAHTALIGQLHLVSVASVDAKFATKPQPLGLWHRRNGFPKGFAEAVFEAGTGTSSESKVLAEIFQKSGLVLSRTTWVRARTIVTLISPTA